MPLMAADSGRWAPANLGCVENARAKRCLSSSLEHLLHKSPRPRLLGSLIPQNLPFRTMTRPLHVEARKQRGKEDQKLKHGKTDRTQVLKRLLDEKKRELLKLLYQDAVFEKLGRNYKTEFERGMDTADWSVVDSIQSLGLKLVDIRQSELIKMSQAQRKLEEGSYGICEECGNEISEQRLAAMIYAIHCLDCAAQNEARGKN